jgi:hypothetical protein
MTDHSLTTTQPVAPTSLNVEPTRQVNLPNQANREVTQRKQPENALRAIVEGTAATIGTDFLASLVRHLAAALDVRYAFIGELKENQLRTLAFWNDDHLDPNIEYPLAGTPCACVVEKKRLCYFPDNLQVHFPEDKNLIRLKA